MIDTKNQNTMFIRISGHQKPHFTILNVLVQTENNNFIFTCTNELQYENWHLFPEKGCVLINKVYELPAETQQTQYHPRERKGLVTLSRYSCEHGMQKVTKITAMY